LHLESKGTSGTDSFLNVIKGNSSVIYFDKKVPFT